MRIAYIAVKGIPMVGRIEKVMEELLLFYARKLNNEKGYSNKWKK